MVKQPGGQPDGRCSAEPAVLADGQRVAEGWKWRAQKDGCPVDANDLAQEQQELLEHSFGIEGMGQDAGKIAKHTECLGSAGNSRRTGGQWLSRFGSQPRPSRGRRQLARSRRCPKTI